MKKNAVITIEVLFSMILNIALGALIFSWLCAHVSTTLATAVGVAVIALAVVFACSFPKLIEKANSNA